MPEPQLTTSRESQWCNIGTANARAGRIDSYALANFYAGYEITDYARIKFGVNNFTDLEYIATRHPQGARAGAPLTAYVNASINY